MNVRELLEHLNVPYAPEGHDHHRPGWINCDCPSCSPDWGHYRLGIKESTWTSHCWCCGFFRLYEILSRMPQVTKSILKGVWPRLRRENFEAGQLSGAKTLFTGSYTPPKGVGPLLAAHNHFLKKRGFDPTEVSELWGVGGIGIASRLAWRLFISINDETGLPVSWTTRSLLDAHGRRYLSASAAEEAVPHKELLYGEDLVPGRAVAVQEGPMDAWAVGPGAVATLGVSVTEAQIIRLAKYPHRFIAFDAEPDAQRRADRLCGELAVFPGTTTNVRWETGKDASRCHKNEVIELREILR